MINNSEIKKCPENKDNQKEFYCHKKKIEILDYVFLVICLKKTGETQNGGDIILWTISLTDNEDNGFVCQSGLTVGSNEEETEKVVIFFVVPILNNLVNGINKVKCDFKAIKDKIYPKESDK